MDVYDLEFCINSRVEQIIFSIGHGTKFILPFSDKLKTEGRRLISNIEGVKDPCEMLKFIAGFVHSQRGLLLNLRSGCQFVGVSNCSIYSDGIDFFKKFNFIFDVIEDYVPYEALEKDRDVTVYKRDMMACVKLERVTNDIVDRFYNSIGMYDPLRGKVCGPRFKFEIMQDLCDFNAKFFLDDGQLMGFGIIDPIMKSSVKNFIDRLQGAETEESILGITCGFLRSEGRFLLDDRGYGWLSTSTGNYGSKADSIKRLNFVCDVIKNREVYSSLEEGRDIRVVVKSKEGLFVELENVSSDIMDGFYKKLELQHNNVSTMGVSPTSGRHITDLNLQGRRSLLSSLHDKHSGVDDSEVTKPTL